MAKKTKSLGAFVKMILGDKKNPLATITVRGKSKRQAAAKAMRFQKSFLKNIDAFWSDGQIHPSRGSKGYDPARTGERQYSRLPKHYGGYAKRMR